MAPAIILLVEDNSAQTNIVRDYLVQHGHRVVVAQNGVAAFRSAQTDNIDLILLDRVLPDMDGSEVCRWLKLNDSTRDIPVIMLTARGALPDRASGLEAGADDYLPKPFDEQELMARISARLRIKNQQDELRQKNRQLENMLIHVETLAVKDALTGLYNRRRFEALLEKEYKRAIRYEQPLSCMMIDIDRFTSVNDAVGHQTGDGVLKECAQVIQSTIRETDTAARWGGEEFAVLSPITTKENCLRAAERIRRAVAIHVFPDLGGRTLTVSIGVAGIPHPSLGSQDALVHAANLALSEAKKNGRDRVESA
jgi:two-component system cell cycle response regulator